MADIKDDKWVTLSEAAAILGISIRTLQRRIEKGEYETKKEGKLRLVYMEISDKMADTMAATQELMSHLKERVNHLEAELQNARQQLQEKDAILEKNRERQDTIVLQLTRQLENQQKLLEYHQEPLWRRWFKKRKKPEDEIR